MRSPIARASERERERARASEREQERESEHVSERAANTQAKRTSAFKILKKKKISKFYYIGGNDSSDSLRIISEHGLVP